MVELFLPMQCVTTDEQPTCLKDTANIMRLSAMYLLVWSAYIS